MGNRICFLNRNTCSFLGEISGYLYPEIQVVVLIVSFTKKQNFKMAWGTSFLIKTNAMKVMIVDDHADMRRVLKNTVTFLAPEQVEFVECESGEEAVLSYQKNIPDWVLMDIELQGIDGFETTSRISEAYPEAKIVFVSSHSSQTFRKQAEKLNAYGFVSKDRLSDIKELIQSSWG